MFETNRAPPGGRIVAPSALLIDLDGVLRVWDPAVEARIESVYALPLGSIAAAAFDPGRLHDAVTGVTTDAQWRAEIAAALVPLVGPVSAAAAVDDWSRSPGQVAPGVLTLIREVRLLVPVALFTNATTRLVRDLDTLGLIREVDLVINSADIGVAKPDARAFQAAVDALWVSASTVVFIDDSPENVTAAASFGMRAHLFTSVAGLRRVAVESGLLRASGR